MKTPQQYSQEITDALWDVNYYKKELKIRAVYLKKAELYLEYLKNEKKNTNS